MTFLNPIVLMGLPLIALPVIIHLINQRRHRTVEWGAMRFLLAAKRVNKGMARLRYLAIMAARMLIIAGLLFAIGRPLATGWFGSLAGGKPETVIVLLDRSASMQSQDMAAGESKLKLGLSKIVDFVQTLGGNSNVVLIDSCTNRAIEVDSPKDLLELPSTQATDSAADIPSMMQSALDYIADNQSGRTDVWICSDGQQSDWDAESSRWQSMQSSFASIEGVRFHVINFSEPVQRNYGITIESARRVGSGSQVELLLDIVVTRSRDLIAAAEVPVELTINGARSVVTAQVVNQQCRITGHRIPLNELKDSGWGKVELPADANTSDNVFYFSYAKKGERRTTIVTEDAAEIESLKMICSVSADASDQMNVEVLSPNQITEIDWNQTALLLWHAPIPEETTRQRIELFLATGRSVFFFPPRQTDDQNFAGVRWGDWKAAADDEPYQVDYWKTESDILGNTKESKPLPLDQLRVFRYRKIEGGDRPLASLTNGDVLLARQSSDGGSTYFCSTLPSGRNSNLAKNGVIAYAFLHRAIEESALSLGLAKQTETSSAIAATTPAMKLLASSHTTLAEQRPFVAGAYRKGAAVVAVNSPISERQASFHSKGEVLSLFNGLDVHVIEEKLGNARSLASEIWRVFIVVACLALVAEAILCMPQRRTEAAL